MVHEAERRQKLLPGPGPDQQEGWSCHPPSWRRLGAADVGASQVLGVGRTRVGPPAGNSDADVEYAIGELGLEFRERLISHWKV